VASIGAIIMILSIALDPFYQQLVSYPQRPNQFGFAGPGRSTNFTTKQLSLQLENGVTDNFIDIDMWDSIVWAIEFNLSELIHDPICASEECYWPQFETLGVCSQCQDVSDLLEYGCLYESGYWTSMYNLGQDPSNGYPQNSTAPVRSCGYFINATSDDPVLVSGYIVDNTTSPAKKGQALWQTQLILNPALTNDTLWDGSIHFKNLKNSWPILDYITSLNTNITALYDDAPPEIAECVLTWCVQTITAQGKGAEYNETMLSTFSNTTTLPRQTQWNWDPLFNTTSPTVLHDLYLQPPSSNETYVITKNTIQQTMWEFGYNMPSYGFVDNVTAPPGMAFQINMERYNQMPTIGPFDLKDWYHPKNISEYSDRLAYSVSNVIRNYKNSSEQVKGFGGVESYIHIRWIWFALPLVILFATLAMLVYTIWDGYRSNIKGSIRKTSLLAAMVHGLDDSIRSEFGEHHGLSEIRKKATEVEIILEPVDDRYKFQRVQSN
jgi:hypothetical protein